ncbi:MAG: NAD(P)H-hydrate dehydratase [Candidatus Omnitrophota bacterium]
MQLPTQLFKRKADSHKNNFGHIFILAGSYGLTGAGILASQAAMRSGAGLVTLGIPKSLNQIIASRLLEAMTKPFKETDRKTLSIEAYSEIIKFITKVNVLVIGPGLSQNKSTAKLIRKLLSSRINIPIVIDADAINACGGYLKILCRTKKRIIITPHPGEFSRLINKPIEYIQKNRLTLAREFAKKYNLTVILKGHNTIVCNQKGEIYINKTGNPGMATAGSGDVLSGIIGALLSQGLSEFNASVLAVYIHGLSGDLAKEEIGEISLIASDLINFLPKAFKKLYNTQTI